MSQQFHLICNSVFFFLFFPQSCLPDNFMNIDNLRTVSENMQAKMIMLLLISLCGQTILNLNSSQGSKGRDNFSHSILGTTETPYMFKIPSYFPYYDPWIRWKKKSLNNICKSKPVNISFTVSHTFIIHSNLFGYCLFFFLHEHRKQPLNLLGKAGVLLPASNIQFVFNTLAIFYHSV